MKKYIIETPVEAEYGERELMKIENDFAAAMADPKRPIITLTPGMVVKEFDVDPKRFDVAAQ